MPPEDLPRFVGKGQRRQKQGQRRGGPAAVPAEGAQQEEQRSSKQDQESQHAEGVSCHRDTEQADPGQHQQRAAKREQGGVGEAGIEKRPRLISGLCPKNRVGAV